jgi:hypothetical protein
MKTWTEYLSAVAERHGLSLPEFLIVDVIRTAFPMTEEEVATFATKFLPEANTEMVHQCIEKGWLSKSADGLLEITTAGAHLAEEIAHEASALGGV